MSNQTPRSWASLCLGHQLAVFVQHAAGVGREVMGDDVALLEDGQQFPDDVGIVALFGVADVHHQPHSGLLGGPLGHPGHLHAHDLQGGRDHSGLDPGDDALVLDDSLDRFVQVDARGAENIRRGGQPGAADVEQADDLRIAVGQDVTGEAAEGVAARTAGVDHGGNARAHAADIGLHSGGIDSGEDVGVQVDQAGRDHPALDLHHLRGLGGINVSGDTGNLAVLDGNIIHAVNSLRRVNYRSALDQQVVHCPSLFEKCANSAYRQTTLQFGLLR